MKLEEVTYHMVDGHDRKCKAEYAGDMIWIISFEHLPMLQDMVDDTSLKRYMHSAEYVEDEKGRIWKKNGKFLDKPEKKDAKPEKEVYAKDVNPKLFNAEYSLYKISQKIRRARKNAPGEGLTLMFHGIPGTGKTYAVKYIADKLGVSYTNVVLSDLLGKYVGETEKAITKAFEEAANGILHIDEFDSLAGNRDMADRNHEVSRVNAFLQAMDGYTGILIVTTNLINKLDKAIIRRFMMKQEFKNLTQSQSRIAAKHFFPDYPMKLVGDGLYAPADFNIVKKSLIFEDMDKVDSSFIEKRLEEEALARNGEDPRKEKPSFGFSIGGKS